MVEQEPRNPKKIDLDNMSNADMKLVVKQLVIEGEKVKQALVGIISEVEQLRESKPKIITEAPSGLSSAMARQAKPSPRG